ncbi:MAG: GNAT family protein [Ktedonobacteraceae bacterium]
MTASSLRIKVDPQLELRILADRDASDLYQLVDSNRAYLREWLPWVDGTLSVEDEQAFIHGTMTQYESDRSFTYAIWWNEHIAGTIGYNALNWANRKVDIGYWLAEQYQGQGIMTRSCRALIQHAFDELKFNRVEILCATMNTRSCAIPQRLGFTYEGTIRQAEWLYDHFVDLKLYGLLASEWHDKINS